MPSTASEVTICTCEGPGLLLLYPYITLAVWWVNLARFEALHAKREQFEKELGESAEWDEQPGTNGARVYVASPFTTVADQQKWPAMMDWLMDQHVRFRRAIQSVGGLATPNRPTLRQALRRSPVVVGYPPHMGCWDASKLVRNL